MKDKLVFVDIYVDRFEHVYPMQVARGSMKDMWLSKTERVQIMRRSFLFGKRTRRTVSLVGLFSQRNYNIKP